MLHALFKSKLKDSFTDPHFLPSEDSKTSCVFGLLQYLPAQIMWNLIRHSCGQNSELPKQSGELLNIEFWAKWSAKGNDITNTNFVEPDVFCEFEEFDLIIEAKKDDQYGQYKQQWKNEIQAYYNEMDNKNKKLIFIAFGGNNSLQENNIIIKDKTVPIYKASWLNLLQAITNEAGNKSEKRLLNDIISAFEKHGFFCLEWFETILQDFCDNNKFNVNSNSKNIFLRWQIK